MKPDTEIEHCPNLSIARTCAFRAAFLLCLLALLCVCAGCATSPHDPPPPSHPFRFNEDTFAFANELKWDYFYDSDGKWKSQRREPPPTYWLHCFVLARSTRQFFEEVRFDPNLPVADDKTYRKLIDEVVSRNRTHHADKPADIIIPGYKNLREFSAAHENLLKQECGSARQSYLQHGHWRMILPFSRNHQQRTAEQLATEVERHGLPVVHILRFPHITINHAVVLFGAKETPSEITFDVYDPNYPRKPATLVFHRASKQFEFPPNSYFAGGKVNVYEVYKSLLY